MLRIEESTSAAAARKYFHSALAPGDYYTEQGNSPGQWFGKAAGRLGLSGEVTPEQFLALADNRNPNQPGERLTARDVKNRRPGYDFTFSPPKSVSVLEALTGDQRITAAFEDSVKDTLSDIEAEMQTRVRKGGENANRTTGNIAASLFLHRTTRPLKEDGRPDCHLHIHGYIFNVTFDPVEKRFKAGQFHDLHIDRPYFEALFHARLAQRLQDLGHATERTEHGFEIAGVPQSVIDTYSRRSGEVEDTYQEALVKKLQQAGYTLEEQGGTWKIAADPEDATVTYGNKPHTIEQVAEELGLTSAAFKAAMGATSRQHKSDPLSLADLRRYWAGRLSSEQKQALRQVRDRAAGGAGESGHGPTAREATNKALNHLLERDSAVSERQLLTEALKQGVGSVTLEGLHEQLKRPDLIRAEIDGRKLVTTAEVLDEEQALVQFARETRGTCVPLGQYETPTFTRPLNDGQRAALESLLSSTDRVQMVAGKAGTGKTHMLQEFRDQVEQRGKKVLAFAPSAEASRGVLASKGFAGATTVAALLHDDKLQAQLTNNVAIIDEVSLVGSKDLRRVFDLARQHNTRLVLVGDERQHRSVPRGQVPALLRTYGGLPPIVLSEIRRQEPEAYRQAVHALSEGLTAEGLAKLDAQGWVHENTDAAERYRQIADLYADTLERGKSVLLLAPTHAEGKQAVQAIRARLRADGKLDSEERTFDRYENRSLTEQQRCDPLSYRAGDMVQLSQHLKGGFRKGERLTVLGRDGSAVKVRTAAGDVRTLPLDHPERLEVFRTGSISLAAGDRIRISHNGYTPEGKHRLNNGSVYTVAGFTRDGDLRLAENGWVVPRDYGHIQDGFYLTSHAAQGKDASVVIVAQSSTSFPASSREQAYVSLSRGKQAIHIFTDQKAALARAIARTSQTHSATEVASESVRRHASEPLRRRRIKQRFAEMARSVFDAAQKLGQRARALGQRLTPPHDKDLGYAR